MQHLRPFAPMLAAALAAVLACPGSAPAQTPGVHVDPGSPAQKEYAIPLDQARGNAATPGGKTAASANRGAPALFGVGITPASRRGRTAASTGAGAHRVGGQSEAGGSASALAAGAPSAGSHDSADAGGALSSPLGLGLGVLMLGLGLGFLFRLATRATSRPTK